MDTEGEQWEEVWILCRHQMACVCPANTCQRSVEIGYVSCLRSNWLEIRMGQYWFIFESMQNPLPSSIRKSLGNYQDGVDALSSIYRQLDSKLLLHSIVFDIGGRGILEVLMCFGSILMLLILMFQDSQRAYLKITCPAQSKGSWSNWGIGRKL